jgi:hypothetical protein
MPAQSIENETEINLTRKHFELRILKQIQSQTCQTNRSSLHPAFVAEFLGHGVHSGSRGLECAVNVLWKTEQGVVRFEPSLTTERS